MTDLVHDAFCPHGALGYLSFLREEWEALFFALHSHSWERMGMGTVFDDTWASRDGHGKEAGRQLDGAYPAFT